ncbi:MAG: hypothetical protein IMF07_04125 [Proteobacteria bacterium]|nr:hypothetical protein [Pseudomonadota bacterium]
MKIKIKNIKRSRQHENSDLIKLIQIGVSGDDTNLREAFNLPPPNFKGG